MGWLSRHSLTNSQAEDLPSLITRTHGRNDYHILVEKNYIPWRATEDAEADLEYNRGLWEDMVNKFDLLIGVLPPVALTSKPESVKVGLSVLIKRQGVVKHLRWELI